MQGRGRPLRLPVSPQRKGRSAGVASDAGIAAPSRKRGTGGASGTCSAPNPGTEAPPTPFASPQPSDNVHLGHKAGRISFYRLRPAATKRWR